MAKRRRKKSRILKSPIIADLENRIAQLNGALAVKDEQIKNVLGMIEKYRSLWAEEKTKFRYYVGEPIEEARKAILGIKK